ncbi:MAG: CHAT domain-containing protein [Anaerolineales bacterium]|nr:CHAT domain-containing protein [Anaerolineales bacterium]
MLVVLSSPAGLESIDTVAERTLIEQSLATPVKAGRVVLKCLDHATLAGINDTLRTFRPHIFHFIGHSYHDGRHGHVLLERADGSPHDLSERTFRELLGGAGETRLVILNSCQSGAGTAVEGVTGLAQQLLQGRVPAVVAMQFSIPDKASLIFTREFYGALALGYPVDSAVNEARRASTWSWAATILHGAVLSYLAAQTMGNCLRSNRPPPPRTTCCPHYHRMDRLSRPTLWAAPRNLPTTHSGCTSSASSRLPACRAWVRPR